MTTFRSLARRAEEVAPQARRCATDPHQGHHARLDPGSGRPDPQRRHHPRPRDPDQRPRGVAGVGRVLGGARPRRRRHLRDGQPRRRVRVRRLLHRLYRNGAGKTDPRAALRWKNAARVRFNIETKTDPREPDATRAPGEFVTAMAGRILAHGLADRADIQSFDFRTLLDVQDRFPQIRTVYLFGDFSICPTGSDAGGRTFCDDSTNFQPLDITQPVGEDLIRCSRNRSTASATRS